MALQHVQILQGPLQKQGTSREGCAGGTRQPPAARLWSFGLTLLHSKTLLIAVTNSQVNGGTLQWSHALVLPFPETVQADGKCLAGCPAAGTQQCLTGWHCGEPKC